MLREIHEQPKAVADTLSACSAQASDSVQALNASELSMVYFTGSGTSYHACLAANYALSTLTRLSSATLPASEFSTWVRGAGRSSTALVAVSQSGESADVLAAVKAATTLGIRTICITNTANSSLANQSEFQLLGRAGTEKAVTATKSFTATLAAAYAFVIQLADALAQGSVSNKQLKQQLLDTPEQIRLTLALSEGQVRSVTSKFADKQLYFILGSGANYSSALEGALKIKESCNVYAEGFATREFLHGPMQLVDARTPILLLQGLQEEEQVDQLAKSFLKFGAPTVVIKRKSSDTPPGGPERIVVAPRIADIFSPLVYVVPLQFYAFYAALERGLNPDSPTKLTKVVK